MKIITNLPQYKIKAIHILYFDILSWYLEVSSINFSNLQSVEKMNRNPKLKKCNMQICPGFCCYDGVYLKPEEEEKLKNVIKSHPEDFPLPAEDYFEDGNWHNKVKGRKTAVKLFQYPSNFPKHFNQTKCMFADDKGLCILQKIALREKIHPWTYKPFACCLFPLIERDGQLIPPPNKGEKDDYFIDEKYPGFVNCLYCGIDCDDGESWTDVLKDEIKYFKQSMK